MTKQQQQAPPVATGGCIVLKPKIGLLGPMPDQFLRIHRQVCELATIVYMDKEKAFPAGVFNGCDYIVISRHARHHQFYKSQSILDHQRVVRLRSGGTTLVVNEIRKLCQSLTTNKRGK